MKSKYISILFVGVLLPASVLAHGGHEIVAKNPQLSKIPDWPPLSSNTGAVGVPEDCNKCARQYQLSSMRELGWNPYRCVFYEGKFGGEAWEPGAGEMAHFTLQLHPNSPNVWRVFPLGGYVNEGKLNLIAEFDVNGKMIFSKSARSTILSEPKDNSASTDCRGGRPVSHAVNTRNLPGNQPTNGKDLGDSGTVVEKTTNDTSVRVQEDCDKYSSPIQILRKIACILANKQPEMSGK